MPFNVARAAETSRKVEEKNERERANRDENFRQKVAIQQFMNANGPIFRAFANRGVQANDVMRSGVLNGLIGNAVALANLTAARMYRKKVEEVTPAEARPFRVGAAEWVAAHWTGGKQIDVNRAAEQIAAAAALVDAQWDHDIYKDDNVSAEASKQITAAAVAGNLFESVAIYSFRLDPKIVVFTVVDAVMAEASKSARAMLPNASEPEIANLMQTIARNLSNLMQACYDQKAREVVKEIRNIPEPEKLAYLEAQKPFDQVMANFTKWATWLAWISPQAASRMAKPTKEDKEDETNEMHPD